MKCSLLSNLPVCITFWFFFFFSQCFRESLASVPTTKEELGYCVTLGRRSSKLDSTALYLANFRSISMKYVSINYFVKSVLVVRVSSCYDGKKVLFLFSENHQFLPRGTAWRKSYVLVNQLLLSAEEL